MTEQKTDRW